MPSPIPRLFAAATDGRLSNPRIQDQQLRRLHASLVDNTRAIEEAISKDTGHTAAEVAIEIALTLRCVGAQIAAIDGDKELEDEYRVAHGRNAEDRVETKRGVAYVEPAKHTVLYSVVAAMSAAVGAACCVVVLLENTTQELPRLLRKLLTESMDADIFAVISAAPASEELDKMMQVLQSRSVREPGFHQVVSPTESRVITIVDRSADVEVAAQALVNARFAFGGSSPYAPDLVLVNEFVKTDFLRAATRKATYIAAGRSGKMRREKKKEESHEGKGVNVVASGSWGSIQEVLERQAKTLRGKNEQNVLVVHAIRSLDDAIELTNEDDDTLLASYIFSDLPSAKYLSQFIKSRASFVKHIPLPLLLGPAAPVGHATSPVYRYTTSMFTEPRPVLVKDANTRREYDELLLSESPQKTQEMIQNAKSDIKPAKARPLKAAPFGYFEQGILIGLASVATPVFVGIGSLGYYLLTQSNFRRT
ncbi:ALDH-like protein [Aulographum hederae CBS 113979]|uniref:ALDH-like protein n=1 Tax=Aulographum hederae CBS 113979 TaxID=1176131 RepID=A0A6G1GVT4_9PEZI|nr:ALDH-like protein [Aulographum hederae CBS 113979]